MKSRLTQKSYSDNYCKASARDVKVHFKNTRETAAAIKGMSINRARQFLENVRMKKEIVPFVRYRYGIGKKAQTKNKNKISGRWPFKSADSILKILKSAESNALKKGLNLTSVYIKNIQVNKAIQGNRRTFRAHGRVNAFSSHPCHIEIWLVEESKSIPRNFV